MFRHYPHHKGADTHTLQQLTAVILQHEILNVKNALVCKHTTVTLSTPYENSVLFHESQSTHDVV